MFEPTIYKQDKAPLTGGIILLYFIFLGETSSWSTSSKAFTKQGAAFVKCRDRTMPATIPEGAISFHIETSNSPVVPGKPTNVYDTTPTAPMLITQNGMSLFSYCNTICSNKYV